MNKVKTGVRIGWVTDLHTRQAAAGTSAIEARRCREVLPALEQALAALRGQVDWLVCTGDMVDDATLEGAAQDLLTLRSLFDSVGLPYMALPGNHDPAPDRFYQVFDAPLWRQTVEGLTMLAFADGIREGDVAATRSQADLARMEQALVEPGQGPILCWQHYLVWPDRSGGYPHNYTNAAAVRDTLTAAARPVLCLSGHYHAGAMAANANNIDYVVARAFCQAPFPYYVLDVGDGGWRLWERGVGR